MTAPRPSLVDSAGDAYITGTAASPDFPVTPGRRLGTPPPSDLSSTRTFLAEFDPRGSVLFSELLGGSSSGIGQAVAPTAQGGIVVSGIATPDFPVTAGVYAATGTLSRPYLMELDPTGATVLFAAFGIGGSALFIDATSDIYMAGATELTDYPTTAGVYQPVFNPVYICYGFCRFSFPGTNQYVTKVNATASKLIYSTAVGAVVKTTNTGLAVDAAGNAYLTGLTYGAYPYTVQAPATPEVPPFLTKIDPAGQHALFSIPIGGAGVAVDAAGHVFAGGSYNDLDVEVPLISLFPLPPPPTASVNAVAQCLLNEITTYSQAYVAQIDSTSGSVQASELVDASNLSAAGISAAGSAVWIAGYTALPDVPISQGALADATLAPGLLPTAYRPGAYLGAVDFALMQQSGVPNVACVLDAAGLVRFGPVAPYQLLSLFGTNLGPEQGVAASDSSTSSLAGVTVTFDGTPGILLYVSQSQVNVAVPVPAVGGPSLASMQIMVNGLASPSRQLPLTQMAPNLFVTVPPSDLACPVEIQTGSYVALAQNQDGSMNSCENPAKVGSVVSFFVDRLGGDFTSTGIFIPTVAVPAVAQVGNLSAEVADVTAVNDFVFRVDLVVPPGVVNGATTVANLNMSIGLGNEAVPVGPLNFGGIPIATAFWVTP
jgi:uncharacterized protein (TIGR03437 family)